MASRRSAESPKTNRKVEGLRSLILTKFPPGYAAPGKPAVPDGIRSGKVRIKCSVWGTTPKRVKGVSKILTKEPGSA